MGFFDAAAAEQSAGRVVRMAPFVRLDTSPEPALYWGSHGDLDLDGERWTGFGDLIGLPTLDQLVNGAASRVTVGLSGVSEDGIRLAIRDRDQVIGRELQIGVAYFGDDWQPLTSIYWIWFGTMDLTPISRTADGEGGGATRSVAVEAASIFSARRRPPLSNYTDRDQQVAHPGDRFCERTGLYRHSTKIWPTF